MRSVRIVHPGRTWTRRPESPASLRISLVEEKVLTIYDPGVKKDKWVIWILQVSLSRGRLRIFPAERVS